MTSTHDDESALSTVTGAAAVIAGLGALGLQLFPLAIPFVALIIVAVIPLAILTLVPVLVLGLLAVPWLVIRRVRRALIARQPQATARPGSAVGGGG
jgi:Flp pilus assembly protein TadB